MFANLSPLLNIVVLSLVASLGTGLGGLIAIIRRPGKRSYGLLMGYTAGVMISLSFLELVNKAWEQAGWVTATIGFGLGAIFMFVLDHYAPHIRFDEAEVPCDENASALGRMRHGLRHRMRRNGMMSRQKNPLDHSLVKTGMLLAVGITIHNLPEGIAVGAGYLTNPTFGIFIAMAILLHNIPEGLATALPLCKAGMNRRDALLVAFLSGLAEPVGALLAALLLVNFTKLLPGALAFAGGVMTFITLDELIPTARKYGHEHYTALGIIAGSLSVFVLSGLFGV